MVFQVENDGFNPLWWLVRASFPLANLKGG